MTTLLLCACTLDAENASNQNVVSEEEFIEIVYDVGGRVGWAPFENKREISTKALSFSFCDLNALSGKRFKPEDFIFLSLTGTTNSHEICSFLDCKNLPIRIELGGSDISDEGLVSISKAFPCLTNLYLPGTDITDKSIPTLCQLKHLKTLHIYDTRITEKGFRTLKEKLPSDVRFIWKPMINEKEHEAVRFLIKSNVYMLYTPKPKGPSRLIEFHSHSECTEHSVKWLKSLNPVPLCIRLNGSHSSSPIMHSLRELSPISTLYLWESNSDQFNNEDLSHLDGLVIRDKFSFGFYNSSQEKLDEIAKIKHAPEITLGIVKRGKVPVAPLQQPLDLSVLKNTGVETIRLATFDHRSDDFDWIGKLPDLKKVCIKGHIGVNHKRKIELGSRYPNIEFEVLDERRYGLPKGYVPPRIDN